MTVWRQTHDGSSHTGGCFIKKSPSSKTAGPLCRLSRRLNMLVNTVVVDGSRKLLVYITRCTNTIIVRLRDDVCTNMTNPCLSPSPPPPPPSSSVISVVYGSVVIVPPTATTAVPLPLWPLPLPTVTDNNLRHFC